MVFPIAGGTQDTSYEIENSLRFNDDDDPYLARTPSSSGSRTKATVSFWVKRGNLKASGDHYILEASSSTSPFNMTRVRFADDLLIIDNTLNGGADNGFYFQSNREYRDPSAWYHIFFSIDVTQANATDGWRLYVNGVQQTKALTYWTQNANLEWSQSGVQMNIGRRHDNGTEHLDGYLTEFHYIDGTIKSYTDFGEFNDNGVWIPKKYNGGSYGTNGFFLEFKQTGTSANSSGMGADTSGNDNHFAVTNLAATDITVDTPTNNFATMNPLSPTQGSITYAEGNLKISASGTSSYSYFPSTFGLSNGKWYAEVKINSQGGNTFIGIAETTMETYNTGPGNDPHLTAGTIWYAHGGNGYYDGSAQDASTFGAASFTSGDIIGLALDLDSGTRTIKFYKNGSLTATKNLTSNFVDPIVFAANLYNTQNQSWNFGNPDFSISSGNADANGYGNFEYAVPSGYYALCTKNLAEYG